MLAIRPCLLDEYYWQVDILFHTCNHCMPNEQCQFQTALYRQGTMSPLQYSRSWICCAYTMTSGHHIADNTAPLHVSPD